MSLCNVSGLKDSKKILHKLQVNELKERLSERKNKGKSEIGVKRNQDLNQTPDCTVSSLHCQESDSQCPTVAKGEWCWDIAISEM